ncbi:hypothetical protein HY414_00895 [Candidatus Kaiserbacteria bacterium]|nr:hypothetical protein [Candidatus Kaiserbacteria bacterium]
MNVVQDTYEKLRSLMEKGSEAEALALLRERMPQLPEELQADILGSFLIEAVQKKARAADIIEKTQREGVGAMKALLTLKESLEKGGAKS